MKIAFQLLKEFWLPFLIGIAWTAYNFSEQLSGNWNFRSFVNIFGPTFFFVSWLVAQWYRVRKQQRVEDGLIGVESHVKQMLNELDRKTADLVGHITGGDSVCYLIGSPVSPDQLGNIALVHHGKHALYNVNARLVDLEVFDQFKGNLSFENIQKSEINRQFGDLIPGHASMVGGAISLGSGETRRFNIFFTARNGSFIQLLRFKRVNGSWVSATKVEKGETRFEKIQDGYPRNESGQVDWDAA